MRKYFPLFLILFLELTGAFTPCNKRYLEFENPFREICVCTEDVCDDVEEIQDDDVAVMYTTSMDGDRMTKGSLDSNETADVTFTLDTSKKEQTIVGFGGAMTDATAINLNRLSDKLAQQLINSYFGVNGLRYNMIRVPIASCDFSTRMYSYLDTPGDFDLNNFTLFDEDTWKITYTRQAMDAASGANQTINVFAASWSAPPWMKNNEKMNGGGQLKDGEQYARAYARYLARFISEYTSRGVPIWALSVQNEPSTGAFATHPFQSMYFSPEMERDFIRDFMKPTLLASPDTQATKIIMHDDFRINLPNYTDVVLGDAEVAKMVDGIAVHWYADFADPAFLTNTSDKYPDHFIIGTEACVEALPRLGDFNGALKYAHDLMEDLTHRVSGWVDWNMALDIHGGPNWVSNFVDSPIIIAPTNDSFFKQPQFYAMGQFSRFIARGARKVSLEVSYPSVSAVAFLNPDDSVVVVVLNESPVLVRGRIGSHVTPFKAWSISTLYFRNESYVGSLSMGISIGIALTIVVLLHSLLDCIV